MTIKWTRENLKSLFEETAGETLKTMNERLDDFESKQSAFMTSNEGKASSAPQIPEANQRSVAGALEVATDPADLGLKAARFLSCLYQANNDRKTAQEMAHARGDKAMAAAFEKSLATAPLASGGALIPEEYSNELIELLRASAVVRSLGARIINMSSGQLTLPKQTGAATLSYLGEEENYSVSQPSFGDIVLSAKKAGGIVAVSEELLNDSPMGVEAIVRDDLMAGLTLLDDVTMIRSAGGQNKPTGIRYQVPTANVLTRTQGGTVSTVAEITYDLGRLRQLLMDNNVPMANLGWIFAPRTQVALETQRDANNNLVWATEMAQGRLAGAPFRSTTQVPTNLVVDGSEVYFGSFNQMIILESGGIELSTQPGAAYHDGANVVSSFSKDQVPIKIRLRNDMKLRHAASFGVIDAVDWGADSPV